MSAPYTLEVREKGSTPEFSLVEVTLQGINRRTVNHGSDSIYRCIGGSVVFHVGQHTYPITVGELVFVPKGTPYLDMSSLGAQLEVCTIPPFDPDQIEYVD